jgi:alanine racemase
VVVTMSGDAPAVLTVDLDAIGANYALVRQVAPRSRVAAVLKANAYGLGVSAIARRLDREGCHEYFVSSLFEALELREVLPAARVYVLEGASGAISNCRRAGLVPVLNTAQEVDEWSHESGGAPAALQVDTGMTRAGLSAHEVADLAARGTWDRFRPELLLTHLACADQSDHPLNAQQVERFARLRSYFPGVPTSIGNSAGIWLGPAYQGDVVRPGIALYGGRPQAAGPNPVRPVARLTARVLQVRYLVEAAAIGYGATAVLPAGSRVATVGAGYADGLPRALGGRGAAHFRGQRLPIVGRVSMDLTTLDVTALGEGGCRVGDEVELLGAEITLEDLATNAATVGYEVLTRLSGRLQRRYIGAP